MRRTLTTALALTAIALTAGGAQADGRFSVFGDSAEREAFFSSQAQADRDAFIMLQQDRLDAEREAEARAQALLEAEITSGRLRRDPQTFKLQVFTGNEATSGFINVGK
ncbi:MAG: hypothetical protein AAGE76_06860 [Pseudomonadota bacterium]